MGGDDSKDNTKTILKKQEAILEQAKGGMVSIDDIVLILRKTLLHPLFVWTIPGIPWL
jgi:hypothetical protein